jgi:hypothetical protein
LNLLGRSFNAALDQLNTVLGDYVTSSVLNDALDQLNTVLGDYVTSSVLNDALDDYPGTTSVVSVGTVTVGTWQATVIEDDYIDSAATWNAKEAALTFQHSLSRSTNTINLDGDSASPGNDKLYGTNGSGTKGWYDQPAAGDEFPSGTAYELLTWDDDASEVVSRDLAGTANQITVTNAAGTITLSLPSAVTVTDLTVSDDLVVTDDASVGGDLTITGALILA